MSVPVWEYQGPLSRTNSEGKCQAEQDILARAAYHEYQSHHMCLSDLPTWYIVHTFIPIVMRLNEMNKLPIHRTWTPSPGGGGVLGVLGSPNFIKRENTLRAWARIHHILVLNSYPDPPFPKSWIRPWSLKPIFHQAFPSFCVGN